jgi:hypothetical protein
MAIATPTVTRIQDQHDAPVLGAGQNGYALTWNNATGAFVATALVTGGLLATGATTGATSQAQAFTVGVTVGSVTTPAGLLQVAETTTSSPRGIVSSQHNAGTDGARFHMRKSRGTNASPTVITSGDVLGRLVASGYDGANYLEMGGIDIVSVGTIASTRVPTEIRFLTATDAAPSVLTQRMVIDKAGNVGIGTTGPAALLHIAGSSSEITRISGDSTNAAWLNTYQDTARRLFVGHASTAGAGIVSGGIASAGTIRADAGLHLTVGSAATAGITITTGGSVGIGTTAPATLLHAVSTTAATDALRNVLTLGANVTSTGVGAAGLGAAVLFTAESTTAADTTMARVQALWYEATHASFKADLVGTAYDAGGEREGWRVRGAGSAAAIGFLGATPQARIAHVADPSGGATVDAEARSAINSILSTLELFGFHATS